MRFGQSTAEQEAAVAAGGSGNFMKYLRKGDNTFQIVDEYEKWTWFWEHYNPGGFPFPCTGERDTCPGCTSSNEKMQRASRRASFNAFDGEYTNVWKVPKTVAEKLKNRHDRLGTITDRPYRITQIQNAEGRYDYDIEGEPPAVLDTAAIQPHLQDPETLLAQAYDEAWGDSARASTVPTESPDVNDQVAAARSKPTIVRAEPEPEKVYSEAELRKMDTFDLMSIIEKEGLKGLPSGAQTSDAIVDWMLTQV